MCCSNKIRVYEYHLYMFLCRLVSEQAYRNSFAFIGTSWTVFEVPLALEGVPTSPFDVKAAASTFKFDLKFQFVTESSNALLFLLHPLNVTQGGLAMPPGNLLAVGFDYLH